MCGIIGILTNKERNITGDLIGALSRLEYRGYDSAGVAISDGKNIHTLKCVGAPSQYLHERDLTQTKTPLTASVGIGHNRWATHGKPTLVNAHPHVDTQKRIAVVHNGTILNYEALRSELQQQGVTFVSETDTEVIPHLISQHMAQGLPMREAFLRAVNRLEGAFGIVAFDVNDSSTLYVAKEGSPIVIGLSHDALYVASSVHGFLPFTNEFVTLHDGEVAILSSRQGLDTEIIRYQDSEPVNSRAPQTAQSINMQDLSKGDFETFMLKEIFEQPATTQATLLGRIKEKEGTVMLGGLFDHETFLQKVTNILFTGCGTAYNATLVAQHCIEKITNITVRNEIASEGKYKTVQTPKETTAVFAVSQSGETADTLEYVKELQAKGYEVFGVVNVVGSAIAEVAGKGIYTKAGGEIGVASTKAFTSQLAALYLLALHLARIRTWSVKEGRKFASVLEQIPHYMKETLALEEEVASIARIYQAFTKIQFLGRGVHVPIAQEASLKFKEITYLETGAYPLGELKHGPIAIIDEETLSVVILPRDELFELGVNSIEQIKSKGGKVLLITDTSAKGHPIIKKVDNALFIPHLEDDMFYPFLEIIPLQLFAYHFAKLLGRNIDKPRNLAKSVTVQ
jgi:glucosamine--fructose-6-phosphate aminotransferase (isomerizing)